MGIVLLPYSSLLTCLYLNTLAIMNPLPSAPTPISPLGRYRLLSPNAAVRVSPICLGAMNFGNAWKGYMGTCDRAATESILDFFYEQGGNFIDTANNYQFEESEKWIGEWMKQRGNRDDGHRNQVHDKLQRGARPPPYPSQLLGQWQQKSPSVGRGQSPKTADELHRPTVRPLVGLFYFNSRIDAIVEPPCGSREGVALGN